MWWSLISDDDVNVNLVTTYGMTGQWRPGVERHSAYVLYLNDTGDVRDTQTSWSFHDPRHFGTVAWLTGTELTRRLRRLGPCVLTSQIDIGIFAERVLNKPWTPICEVLLDQSALAGVGNYMRAEILRRSLVDPWKAAGVLTADQMSTLHRETLAVARESYEAGGSTIESFESPDGSKGGFSERFLAYGRKTDPEGNEVVRRRDANGRTVHWCPAVQI